MAEPISIQQLKDASEDAITLADFIYKPANVMIPRRLAADINSLQYYLDYMSSYAQHSYETYDEMVANAPNLSENVSIFVTNDLDTSKNGIYTYNGVSFVKGDYQPEKAAKDYVESKLGGLEVFDGKVRAQDVSTVDGSTQDVKNTEFRNELDGLPPFKDGVLADTFVTVNNNQTQREVNQSTARVFKTLTDMVADTKITAESYATTLGYTEREDGGGRSYYISSEAGTLSVPLVNGLHAIPSIGHEITSMDLGIARGGTGSTSVLNKVPDYVNKLTLIDCHLKTESPVDVIGTGRRLVIEGINSRISDKWRKTKNDAGVLDKAYVFYGLCFIGFKHIEVNGITLSDTLPDDYTYQVVHKDEVNTLRPELQFFRCESAYFSSNMDSTMSAYAPLGSKPNDSNRMGSFPLAFNECGYVNTEGTVLSNKIRGEMIGIVECAVVDFLGISHKQTDTDITFWSLAKIIDCGTVNIDRLDIDSESVGSLIDVLAEYVHIGGANIYKYPGKFYDITSENSATRLRGCKNVYIAPMVISKITDSDYYPIFNSYYELEGYDTVIHDNLVIESMTVLPQSPPKSAPVFYIPYTRNTTIKHVDAWDAGGLLYTTDYRKTEEIFTSVTIENLILNRSDGFTGGTVIDAGGKLIINSGRVNNSQIQIANRKKGGTLADSYKAGYMSTISNVDFTNTELSINGSMKFINCKFDDSFFSRYRTIDRSIYLLEFENCSFYSNTEVVPFFTGIGADKTVFRDCTIDVSVTGVPAYPANFPANTEFYNSKVKFNGMAFFGNVSFYSCEINSNVVIRNFGTIPPEVKVILKDSLVKGTSKLLVTEGGSAVDVLLVNNGLPVGYETNLVSPYIRNIQKANNYVLV